MAEQMHCQNSAPAFVWGAASAAYQIEGAYLEDGKGLSIWDVYTHDVQGKTKATGDIACDHYHRYKEDVRLMAELGIKAYRFSLSWSRIMPTGYGEVNEKGLRFYDALIDELLKYGIDAYVTLYHWDLPQGLFERGGWLNPEISDLFAAYAEVVGRHFGDRVKNFITINEPTNVIEGMTPGGTNAPSLGYSLRDRLTAVHNLLLSHGKAVMRLRETVPDAKIGFAPCSTAFCPQTEEDTEAAGARYFRMDNGDLTGNLVLYCDPVFFGDYPKEYYDYYRDILPKIKKEDLAIISQPIDFCMHNIYSGLWVNHENDGFDIDNHGHNMLGWPVTPEAIYWSSRFLWERYKKPLIITENGYASPDTVDADGCVHDGDRVEFIRLYTDEIKHAIRDGIDVRGYFYWSIMDNLEWELGFGPRFGLIHVDFETQKRTPKDSYCFYRSLIKEDI